MNIVCFGDSLTYGNIGYSYRKNIDASYHIINKGINGDTTIHLIERMKRYIESRHNGKIDIYIIAIGTNDLLLPYLTTVSRLWKLQIAPRVRMMRCILEDEVFEAEYEKLLQLLREHHKKGIAVGIPMCQLLNFPNERVQIRNKIIKRLADKYQVPFIDSFEIQKQAVLHYSVSHTWKNKNILRIVDAIVMTVFPFTKDYFSRVRHLELTVDGVHYNLLSANIIGKSINESIISNMQ